MAILRLVYEVPDPKNFETSPLNTDTAIKAVLYSCSCCCVKECKRAAVLFPKKCPVHDQMIIGYWTHLSLTKKNLKRIKFVL